jgi:hypothetical protein
VTREIEKLGGRWSKQKRGYVFEKLPTKIEKWLDRQEEKAKAQLARMLNTLDSPTSEGQGVSFSFQDTLKSVGRQIKGLGLQVEFSEQEKTISMKDT